MPEDQITKLSERISAMEAKQDTTHAWVRDIDAKVDKLVEAVALGKGAGMAVLKMGAGLVAVAAGLVWIGQHFGGK